MGGRPATLTLPDPTVPDEAALRMMNGPLPLVLFSAPVIIRMSACVETQDVTMALPEGIALEAGTRDPVDTVAQSSLHWRCP